MSRLVVVSNRVPSLDDGQCTGGLSVALQAALGQRGGLWLGWSGRISEEPKIHRFLDKGVEFAAIDLTQQEFNGYYAQYANRSLWPLFHDRVDLTSIDYESYGLSLKVNRRFAATLLGLLRNGDTIWVHDYHLIPLGTELRRLGVTGALGFFLHTPFPSPEILTALPWHRELLAQLCSYDLVGLQTRESLRNFNRSIELLLPKPTRHGDPRSRYERTSAGCYPISIDTRAFAELADSESVQCWRQKFNAIKSKETWVIGVERLDYTKGLPERFTAFETMLDQYPSLQRRVSLVQIAAPSREALPEYQALQEHLEALSGRINARLATLDWQPIRYLNRRFDHTQLAALYRTSSVGLVTPLRDGMNIVAKEYVAAQDPENPGVLVLSCFAGAAQELTDAVLVNPFDNCAVARALRTALEMPLDERKFRWMRMMRQLLSNDVDEWCSRFLASLSANFQPASASAAIA